MSYKRERLAFYQRTLPLLGDAPLLRPDRRLLWPGMRVSSFGSSSRHTRSTASAIWKLSVVTGGASNMASPTEVVSTTS
jgi:hypothetical protein